MNQKLPKKEYAGQSYYTDEMAEYALTAIISSMDEEDEPLDGDETEAIAGKLLVLLNEAQGNTDEGRMSAKTELIVPVYYAENDAGRKTIDVESMQKEFEGQIAKVKEELNNQKYGRKNLRSIEKDN